MKRWRLRRKRLSMSKSMSNVSQDKDESLDLSSSGLRNAASISDVASLGLWDEARDGEDETLQQENEVFNSTHCVLSDEEEEENNAVDKAAEQKEAASFSDVEERSRNRYEPVYTRNIAFRSKAIKSTGSSSIDQSLLQYNAYNPRPSSLNLQQEFSTLKATSEKLMTESDLNGNLLTTAQLPERSRRISVDVLRSQFASSSSKDSSKSDSKESEPRLPSITIEDVDEEKQDTHEKQDKQNGGLATPVRQPFLPRLRHLHQDSVESSSAPPTPTTVSPYQAKMEASSSLEDEDLPGNKIRKDSSTEGEKSGSHQTSDSSALVVKSGQKSGLLDNKATKRMLRLFARLPLNEKALDYYSCALLSDILLHGTLYITNNYIAFYSKIFYHVSRVLIPSRQIKRVAKVRTAKIIPNGVGIYLHDGRRFLFGSLLSRDATYNLLIQVATASGGMAISDNEAQEPQSPGQGQGEDDTASSGHSQTDQDAQSAHSSSSNSSTPSIERAPNRPSLVHKSSFANLEKVDEASPLTTSESQDDQVDSAVVPGDLRSRNVKRCGAEENDSSSEDCQPMSAASSATASSKSSSYQIQERASRKKEISPQVREHTQEETSFIRGVFRKMFHVLSTRRSTIFNALFFGLLGLLVVTTCVLMYRIQKLSDEITAMSMWSDLDESDLLELQQRLHSSAASEMEKALEVQLQHLAMVRRSLTDLTGLFQSGEFDGHNHPTRPVGAGASTTSTYDPSS